ncbi:c-type cytochrome [Rubritalea spongiae]|uniref:C-type cytochrome n=1 Tax=Rubritalea spongiae TaxID=430797 RepID=A0ABW5E2E1_9BACT
MNLVLKIHQSVVACSVLLASPLLAAEDGKQIYQLNCVACHGAMGEGAGAGTFPPLAQSEWLSGTAERSIQILLHGLEGPVDVNGKTYNLAMPPQGALNDAQIAAVLTYVRSHFGNKESAVTTKQVVAARKKSENRSSPWTANALLKEYPFPKQEKVLKDIVMEVYKGKWEMLPDFSQIDPDAVEEEAYGLFSFRNVAQKKQFGVVWQGEIVAPEDAEYCFEMMADDGARLSVAGNEVVSAAASEAKGEWRIGKVKLKKGANPIQLEYYQLDGGVDLQLRWFGPGISRKQLLTDRPKGRRKKPSAPVIDLTPTNKEAALYNNFITGTTSRALGVGYPGGVNTAFSTEHCAPELLWRGKFISGGRHWTGRGQGTENPLSKDVVSLTGGVPYRIAAEEAVNWQDLPKVQYLGYSLDTNRYPTFRYRVGQAEILEKSLPNASGMQRHLKITSDKNAYLAVLLAKSGSEQGSRELLVDKKLRVTSTESIQKGPEGYYTLLPLKKGTNTFTLNYSWD